MQITFDAGAAIIGVVALVGGFIVRDRQVMKAIGEGDGKIHDRVDDCVTKQDLQRVEEKTDMIVKEYVQKSDLESQLEPMKTTLSQISVSIRESNRRMDKILETVLGKKS
jgi:hypothetical protein